MQADVWDVDKGNAFIRWMRDCHEVEVTVEVDMRGCATVTAPMKAENIRACIADFEKGLDAVRNLP